MEKIWEITGKYSGNSSVLEQLLEIRGYDSDEKIEEFLNISSGHLYSPFLLKDVSKAIDRLFLAKKRKELVMLYGDYDVDGVTSVVLLAKLLQYMEIPFFYFHPHRLSDGYGFHVRGVNIALSREAKLIITADCGISDPETVDYAKKVGIDVIITDHHCPLGEIPEAVAVINPKRPDCPYPNKYLAGVGVVLKLVQAVFETMTIAPSLEEYLEIAALGTVVDVVPIIDENRTITKLGLDIIGSAPINPGITALLKIAGIHSQKINCGHLGFQLGPRLNAAGRVSRAELATEFLLASQEERVQELAHYLNTENMKRKAIVEDVLNQAIQKIENEPHLKEDKIIVLSGTGWHRGVLGIVASKVQSIYYKPIIIISIEENIGHGSARSIPAFNIFESLQNIDSLLIKFGGHSQAAGITINEDKIDQFRRKINKIADMALSEDNMIERLIIDMDIDFDIFTLDTIRQIELMQPHSIGNPTPVFATFGCELKSPPRRIGQKGEHLKFKVSNRGKTFDCVYWQAGNKKIDTNNGFLDIAYTPSVNEWKGNQQIQLEIKDCKVSERHI
ncbi:MAG: single-stranded-DNA-specific exonuclease RecJ [bacterium]